MFMKTVRVRLDVIILHAAAYGPTLRLWGELSGDDPARQLPRKKTTRSTRHPYAVGAQEIRNMLRSQFDMLHSQHHSLAGVLLPCIDGMPLPSDGTAHTPPGSDPRISLKRWSVEPLLLPVPTLVSVLFAVAHNRTSIAGMAVAPDLAYWSDALRFAGLLAARQQFLPNMSPYYGRVVSHWTPVFLGDNHERLLALAKRMPASVRAFDPAYYEFPSGNSSVAALIRILSTLVNHLVCSAATDAVSKAYVRKRHFDSVDDDWLHDLRTNRGRMKGSDDAFALAKIIQVWRQGMEGLAHPSLRMCFRLEEPEEATAKGSDRRWFIRYLLRSRSDPSLIIPADKIWDGEGIAALGNDGRHAKEFLLTSLGLMSPIVTGMSAGLEKYGMAGYAMDTGAAHRFMSKEAPMLEQLGYIVMLPAWWAGGMQTRLTARLVATPRARTGRMLDIGSIMEFDWKLAIGDYSVTLEDLQRLADAKSPLVNMRGQWMEAGSEKIRKAADFLKKKGRMTVRDLVLMELGSRDAPEWMDLSVSGRDDLIAGMMETLRGNAEIRELPQPDGFAGTLRPYQLRGYSWLAFLEGIGLGGCLADDMGLGKTVQMLALAQQRKMAGRKGPILLVCPTSVMDNWRREAARFTPELSVTIHHGTGRRKGEEFARDAAGHDIVVSSYGLVHRDIEFIRRVRWGGVVLDEAQNIKNPETKQSKAVRSLDAGFRFALTGTPVENSVGDMWSIMEFLNPGLLGTRAEFRRNFFLPIQADRDEQAAETLRRITGPFMLRRLKTDRTVITDLPEKMEMNIYCSLTREQASLYAALLKSVEDGFGVDGIKRKGMILATLTKLKQVCNHPAHLLKDGSPIAGRSGKLARLTEMLEEVISSGERALVFTQFVEMGEILRRHIAETFGREVPFLHGGVPKKRRDAMVEGFQNGGSDVFIVSLKAGGTGLNLTAANHVFHFDRWWNPAVENQATDRVFRIGQDRNVQVHKMICAGTLEERIDEILNRKREISEGVVGTGEGWLTKMSDVELREVLALSKEATRL